MNKCVRFAVALAAVAGLAGADEAKTEAAKVAGQWELTRELGQMGPMTSNVTFEQDGETLKGTISGRRGDNPLTGTVKGNKVTFSFSVPGRDGQTRTMEYVGTVEGDTMKGETESPRGKVQWTAKRAAKTEAPAGDAKPPTP